MEAFVKGTRQKLRFNVAVRNTTLRATIEDLWDLSIDDLDKLAVSLDEEVTNSATKSFVKTPTAANAEAKLKFEVVKYILDIKLAEKEKAKLAKEKLQKKNALLELLEQKETEKLKGKSIEEIQAELLALEEA